MVCVELGRGTFAIDGFVRRGRRWRPSSAFAGPDHGGSSWILPGRSRSVGRRLKSRKALGAVVGNRISIDLRESSARLVEAIANKH